MGSAILKGVSSCLWTSYSAAGSCDGKGWKTAQRCSANVVAFCLSVLAQLLSLFLIGGICCFGCFILRVAFHKEYSVASVGVSPLR
jgi:hypothetical protein